MAKRRKRAKRTTNGRDRIKKLVEELVELLKSQSPRPGTFPVRMQNSPRGSLAFFEDDAPVFEQLVDQIERRPEADNRFGRSYLASKAVEILLAVNSEADTPVEEIVDRVLHELGDYDQEHEVIVPIEGLEIDDDSWALGRVTLHKVTASYREGFHVRLKTIMEATLNSPEERAGLIRIVEKHLAEYVDSCAVVASSRVVAEPDQATTRAVDEVERMLDLVRFYIPYAAPFSEAVGVGVPGRVRRARLGTVRFTGSAASVSSSEVGQNRTFRITTQVLQHLRRLKIDEFSEVLSRDSRTDLENKLVTAVEWCSHAQSASLPEQRLTSFMTALEGILNASDGRPVRLGVAENAAMLIGGPDLERRREIKIRIRDLYDLRSAISHGSSKSADKSEVGWLAQVVAMVMLKVLDLRAEHSTRESMVAWLDDLRLVDVPPVR